MCKYIDGHIYHVYNRGAHRHSVFRKPTHYRKCIELLKKYAAHYQVSLLAYCLMPNRYHLLVRQEASGTVSRFLQTTFNAYVQYFNVLEGHSGTLFQGPAKSRSTDTDEYLVQIVCYIHSNPVWASLVKDASDRKYSDYEAWLSDSDDNFAGRLLRDALFQDGKSYQRFVEAYRHTGDEDF